MKNLELISIHINKTAGKSFRSILQRNYGSRLYNINVDDSNKKHRSVSCKSYELVERIPSYTKVIHGHFTVRHIIPLLQERPIPIITWLRDPVERVISNYYHDLNNGYTELDMIDYIALEDNINKMSKMLDGLPLDRYTIGFQHRFDSDLNKMGRKFNWAFCNAPLSNVGKKQRVSSYLREMIRDINSDDVDLYKKAKGR